MEVKYVSNDKSLFFYKLFEIQCTVIMGHNTQEILYGIH